MSSPQSIPTILPLPLRFSTAFLVKEKSIILIDTGMTGNGQIILEKIRALGKLKDLSLIIITHGHMDHIGSLPEVVEATGAAVMIHSQDREALSRGRKEFHVQGFLPKLVTSLMRENKKWKPVEPTIVINGETSLAEYGIDGMVIPTPGHTMGSITVLLPSGEAFIGDLMGSSILSRGKPNYPFFVEDRSKVEESVRMLLNRGAKIFYMAHGGPFTAEEVSKKFNPT